MDLLAAIKNSTASSSLISFSQKLTSDEALLQQCPRDIYGELVEYLPKDDFNKVDLNRLSFKDFPLFIEKHRDSLSTDNIQALSGERLLLTLRFRPDFCPHIDQQRLRGSGIAELIIDTDGAVLPSFDLHNVNSACTYTLLNHDFQRYLPLVNVRRLEGPDLTTILSDHPNIADRQLNYNSLRPWEEGKLLNLHPSLSKFIMRREPPLDRELIPEESTVSRRKPLTMRVS